MSAPEKLLSEIKEGAARHHLAISRVNPDYRLGQASFNFVDEYYPKYLPFPVPPEVDPFYRDDKLQDFWALIGTKIYEAANE